MYCAMQHTIRSMYQREKLDSVAEGSMHNFERNRGIQNDSVCAKTKMNLLKCSIIPCSMARVSWRKCC